MKTNIHEDIDISKSGSLDQKPLTVVWGMMVLNH